MPEPLSKPETYDSLAETVARGEPAALRDVELAAREAVALIGGRTRAGNWRFGEAMLRDASPEALALLSLTDYLNTLDAVRGEMQRDDDGGMDGPDGY